MGLRHDGVHNDKNLILHDEVSYGETIPTS